MKEFPTVPRIRALHNLSNFIKNPLPIFQELSKEYGDTFYFYLVGVVKTLITLDPELTQFVLRSPKNFEKSEIQTERLAKYTGTGLATSKGELWKKQRRLMQPSFHREKVAALSRTMKAEIDAFISALVSEKVPLDLSAQMNKLTFSVICQTLFSTDSNKGSLHEVRDIVDEMQNYFILKERLAIFHWLFVILGIERKKHERSARCREIIGGLITERRQGEPRGDLLDLLLEARYEDGSTMSYEQLIDECLILIVAGHETAANVLTWTVYELLKSPELFKQVRSEADLVYDDDATKYVKNLNFAEKIAKETLRLYPPIWGLDRISIRDCDFTGNVIPKGTSFLILVYGVHRNPKYWPNPDTFDPDRFDQDGDSFAQDDNYIPFGSGPRFCIGQAFAMLELKLVIAELARRVEMKTKKFGASPEPKITLRQDSVIEVSFSERQELPN